MNGVKGKATECHLSLTGQKGENGVGIGLFWKKKQNGRKEERRYQWEAGAEKTTERSPLSSSAPACKKGKRRGEGFFLRISRDEKKSRRLVQKEKKEEGGHPLAEPAHGKRGEREIILATL